MVKTVSHQRCLALTMVSDTERMDIALLRHKPTIENIKKRWAGIVTDDQRKEAIVDYRMWKDERAEVCRIWCDETQSPHVHVCG